VVDEAQARHEAASRQTISELNLHRAAAFVIDQLEGGDRLVEDSGGLTRWGISQRAYPAIDIRALTREDALALYARDYWAPTRAGELPDALGLCVFDGAVNQGVHAAVDALQEVLRVERDGVVGPDTLAAARHTGPETIVKYLERRLERYENLCRTKPYYLPNLRGWRSRVLRVAMEAARWRAL
jgi:lysozyme family protein